MLKFRDQNNDSYTVLVVGTLFFIITTNSLCCGNTTITLTNTINLIMIQLCFDNNSYVTRVRFYKIPRNKTSVSIINFIFSAIPPQKFLTSRM